MVAANTGSESVEKSAPRKGTTSSKRVAANRENAKHSTGPKTPAGKAASRMNAVRHGLCATMAILEGDDAETFEVFADGIYDSFRPRDQAEAVLVDRYVSISWKLRRVGDSENELNILDNLEVVYDLATEHCEAVARRYHAGKMTPEEAKAYPNPAQFRLPDSALPGAVSAGRMLAVELRKGDGPMLRLMSLEDRLRRTLGSVVRQLKDLRTLRRVMEETEGLDDRPVLTRKKKFEAIPLREHWVWHQTEPEVDVERDVAERAKGRGVENEVDAPPRVEPQVEVGVAVREEADIEENEANAVAPAEPQDVVEAGVPAEADIVRNEPNVVAAEAPRRPLDEGAMLRRQAGY